MNNEAPELIWISVDKRLHWTDYNFDGGIPYRRVDPPAAPAEKLKVFAQAVWDTFWMDHSSDKWSVDDIEKVLRAADVSGDTAVGASLSSPCEADSISAAAHPAAPDERDKALAKLVLARHSSAAFVSFLGKAPREELESLITSAVATVRAEERSACIEKVKEKINDLSRTSIAAEQNAREIDLLIALREDLKSVTIQEQKS